jgi:hypothetical protein
LAILEVEEAEAVFVFEGELAMPIMISTPMPIPTQWITLSFFSFAPQWGHFEAVFDMGFPQLLQFTKRFSELMIFFLSK